MPTGAALLILLSARNGIFRGADSLLSSRALVELGGISYGMYLWHFPLLAFYRSERGTDANSIKSGLAIIVAAVVLAFLTQRLVERPVLALRPPDAERAQRAVLTGLVAASLVVVVGSTAFADAQQPTRRRSPASRRSPSSSPRTPTRSSPAPARSPGRPARPGRAAGTSSTSSSRP